MTLTLKNNRTELMDAYNALYKSIPNQQPIDPEATKAVIFAEIERLNKLEVPGKAPVAEAKAEVKEEVKETDAKLETIVKSLVKSSNELDEYIKDKKVSDRSDKFLQKALGLLRNSIHRIHLAK